ncbi:MAG: hypothetical protein WCH99_14995 [Verrucomicrobiota bacterium]
MQHQKHQATQHSLTGGISSGFTLLRRVAGAAVLAVWLAAAPGATAAEVLQNGSFAAGTNYWQSSPELTAWGLIWLPSVTNYIPIGTNLLILHPVHGFLGPIVSQDLNVPNVAGANLTAAITLSKFGGPPGPTNSIAIYADYVDAGGLTNRILLQNPADADLPYGISTVTNQITLPSSARTLVRYAIVRLQSGTFESSGVSLDVVTSAAPPELGLSIIDPTEGVTNTAPFLLRAGVTNLTTTVSSLVFCANGIPIGEGRLDPHGEWIFADGSHLSVMGGGGYEMVDYSEPYPGDMFFMNGAFTSQTNFAGGFQYFPSGGGMSGGSVSVVYSVDATDRLTAAITGDAPLGVRTLSNGTNLSATINYGYFWANAPAGSYAITVRAIYGDGLSVTSAPVNITVIGSVPVAHPTLGSSLKGSNLELAWPTALGQNYQLQSVTNLSSTNWLNEGSFISGTGGVLTNTLPTGGAPTKFFRLLLLGN